MLGLLVVLALGALAAVVTPRLAVRLPGAVATGAVTAVAAVTGLSTFAVLAALALDVVGQLHAVAAAAELSAPVLRHADRLETVEGGVVTVAAAAVAVLAAAAVVRRAGSLLRSFRTCSQLPGRAGELVVVPGLDAAFSVPGRPGRIVVGAELLRGLDRDERRAVLAHERAHLRHGHHWYLSIVTVTTPGLPWRRRLLAAAELATERWADEAAARDAGREATASALVRAAGGRGHWSVPPRLEALSGTGDRPRASCFLAAVATALALVAGAGAHTVLATAQTVDEARDAYAATHADPSGTSTFSPQVERRAVTVGAAAVTNR